MKEEEDDQLPATSYLRGSRAACCMGKSRLASDSLCLLEMSPTQGKRCTDAFLIHWKGRIK